MARQMKAADVIDMAVTYFPAFLRQRKQAQRMSKWVDGRQYDLSTDADGIFQSNPSDVDYGRAYAPTGTAASDDEYENLRGLAPNPFARLVVATVAQTAYIEGITRPGIKGNLPTWDTFRRNRWITKQGAVHRCAIGQAVSYGVVIKGEDPLTGSPMAKMMARSPQDMAAFYDTDDDEWATLAVEAYPRFERPAEMQAAIFVGWTVAIWDVGVVHRLSCTGNGETSDMWEYITFDVHEMPVVPVVPCYNQVDLHGRATGEIEPVLPILRRIDQDVFDRLITQRFGAWQVRYISGMAKPKTDSEKRAQKLKLRQEDILISTSEKTKFGTLPAGPLQPLESITQSDIQMLAVLTQLPSYQFTGLHDNLAAEAVSAAREGLSRKSFDFKTNAGDFHEQMARLTAMAEGDMATALAYDLKVRWRNTELDDMSLQQAAQGLGTLAVQLKVPLEMLWEQIPGWTDDDVERARGLAESGALEQLLAMVDQTLNNGQGAQQGAGDAGGGSGNGNAD
jgi:hypothetical protein